MSEAMSTECTASKNDSFLFYSLLMPETHTTRSTLPQLLQPRTVRAAGERIDWRFPAWVQRGGNSSKTSRRPLMT